MQLTLFGTRSATAMTVTIRPARPEDAETCGAICYDAFTTIAAKHGFPPDFRSADIAIGAMSMFLSRSDVFAIVAERGGRIVGSNFLWETSSIAGIGPITVSPADQDSGAGRRLMDAALIRVAEKGFPGVRLVQSAYHNRSLSLYTRLGFDAREPLSVMQGEPIGLPVPGHSVRRAGIDDVAACNRLAIAVHGHERFSEIQDAAGQGTLIVVEHDGRISGYSTTVGFFGHSVGETNNDIKALIAASPGFAGMGFLLPTRNSDLFRWCLAHGLRVVQPMTLMSRGLYNHPDGAFLPSIIY
jgi:predicted N-acetyltransferase YhbS